jgi:hypothetical protein
MHRHSRQQGLLPYPTGMKEEAVNRLLVALSFVFVAACGGPMEEADLDTTSEAATASEAGCAVTPNPVYPGADMTITGWNLGTKRELDFVAYYGTYPSAEVAVYASITDNRGNVTLTRPSPTTSGPYQLVVWKNAGARSQTIAATCYFDVLY